MIGGGTCRDVCADLDIECVSFDLMQGQDANDWTSYRDIGRFDFIWLHPPYWRQIVYNDDPRCLSNAPTLGAFVRRLRGILRRCRSVLTAHGKIAVLMGNYCDHGRFMPLVHFTMQAALAEGLWPACTEIVRLQYHNRSSQKTYQSSLIPGVHDTCLVFHPQRASKE